MSRESDYLINLEKALQRIKDGTYGICEVSGELISKERLMEVPNATKSVINKEKKGLYFSRSPIPFFRSEENSSGRINNITYLRHIGIYSFSAGSLRSFVKFGECELEKTERLEQLRWLWMGKQIKVLRDDSCLGLGVDTIEDLQKVLLHLQKMK